MSAPDPRAQTRHSYDVVAADYARLLPTLAAETRLDVAMIDDFVQRCTSAGLGPVGDVGCGTGRVAAHLAARGLDVLGIDQSPGMVEVARAAHPDLRFVVGSLEELPLPDAALGGLLAWYSVIHTPPSGLATIVSELARTLLPSAWLLMAFHSGDGRRVERTTAYGHQVPMTTFLHDPAQVTDVLLGHGFDLHVRLDRSPENGEQAAQSLLLARR